MQSWAVATTDKPKQKSGRPRDLIAALDRARETTQVR
jgi:hypothetical protein